ncbi:MAG: thioredoxin domain-containing protein [archaeon]
MKKKHSEKIDSEKTETPKTSEKKSLKMSTILKDLSKNYWAISTIVLTILLIITLLTGGLTGAVVSSEEAGQNVLTFALQQGADAELISTSDSGSLYEVILSIKGEDGVPQEVPVYVTKDGQTLVPQPIPLTTPEATETPEATTQEQTEIPKSDKPIVDLFIWAYCPYGVMAQEPFAEVASLLSGKAEFNAIMYYDGHGPYETQQNKIQACIQKLDSKNYWNYATGFVTNIYPVCGQSRDIECDKTESIKLMNSLGIDSTAVMSCVETQGATLVQADSTKAQNNRVTGSPTIMINGVKANVARNAEAIKAAICSAYNVAPEECANTLDATTAQAQGNC